MGFAGWGLLAPASLAQVMGWETRAARLLGARELAVGATLLAGPPRPGLLLRALCDVGDALTTAEERPAVAKGAAISSVVALLLALASGTKSGR